MTGRLFQRLVKKDVDSSVRCISGRRHTWARPQAWARSRMWPRERSSKVWVEEIWNLFEKVVSGFLIAIFNEVHQIEGFEESMRCLTGEGAGPSFLQAQICNVRWMVHAWLWSSFVAWRRIHCTDAESSAPLHNTWLSSCVVQYGL